MTTELYAEDCDDHMLLWGPGLVKGTYPEPGAERRRQGPRVGPLTLLVGLGAVSASGGLYAYGQWSRGRVGNAITLREAQIHRDRARLAFMGAGVCLGVGVGVLAIGPALPTDPPGVVVAGSW